MPLLSIHNCHNYSSYICYKDSMSVCPAAALDPCRPDTTALRSRRRVGRSARAPGSRGDFCYYVDSRGHQHFNFAQRIWLSPSVQMAVTPVMTVALQTLAINLLMRGTHARGYRAAVGATSSRMVGLASRFCVECLLSARPGGWVIPRATVRAWLVSQRRMQAVTRGASRVASRGPGRRQGDYARVGCRRFRLKP
jgi:hypothetical protein